MLGLLARGSGMQFDHLKRRDVIKLLGGAAAAWPLAARAQQTPKPARIGFLGLSPASAWTNRIEALWAGLHQLGYAEGKNLIVD